MEKFSPVGAPAAAVAASASASASSPAPRRRFNITPLGGTGDLFGFMDDNKDVFDPRKFMERHMKTDAQPPGNRSAIGSGPLRTDDSRSSTASLSSSSSHAFAISGEDSNYPTVLRHEVDQDRRLAADYSNDAELDEFLRDEAEAKRALEANSGFIRSFRFYRRGQNEQRKRKTDDVMEEAPEYDIHAHPDRILLAVHVKRKFYGGSGNAPASAASSKPTQNQYVGLVGVDGKPLSPYTYQFSIASSTKMLLSHLERLPPERRTLFAVVEEDGSVFAFFDLEIEKEYVKPEVHGTSPLNLFGYCIAVMRALLSMQFGLNVACFSTSYVVFESADKNKWSAHVHVGWPFADIGALRDVMSHVTRRLWDLKHADVEVARPLFYYHEAKAEWRSVIDTRVYTKNRNFRLPECTKCDKNAWLRLANDRVPEWNNGATPCAVKDLSEPFGVGRITSGLILCRNSRAFWNSITVRTPELLTASNRTLVAGRPGDFRVLPNTGRVNAYSTRLRELYYAPDDKCSEADARLAIDLAMKELYGYGWDDAVAQSATGDAVKAACDTLRRKILASGSARRVACFLLVWTRFYQPGQSIVAPLQVPQNTILLYAVETACHLTSSNSTDDVATRPFVCLMGMYGVAEAERSRACTQLQRTQRTFFISSLADDFLKRYYSKHISNVTYLRDVLTDVLVADSLVQHLLLYSGLYALTMAKDNTMPGAAMSPLLLDDIASYTFASRDKMYEQAFRSALTAEGKQRAWTEDALYPASVNLAQPRYSEKFISGALLRTRERMRRQAIEGGETGYDNDEGNRPFCITLLRYRPNLANQLPAGIPFPGAGEK